MSALSSKAELLLVTNDPSLTETGGSHAAKGLDFQRWWAVLRMVELRRMDRDFLLLFEAVQDVTELNSHSAPTAVTVYQVKKKDTGLWSWPMLTGTAVPKPVKRVAKTKSPTKATAKGTTAPFAKVGDSILGKLHRSVFAFPSMAVEGYFISNVGCNIPLAAGGNSATAMPHNLNALAPDYMKLLSDALTSLGSTSSSIPDLSKLKLKTVAIHPNDLSSPVIAAVLDMLNAKSPEHAPQARAFAEALVMKISPLGRHTQQCATFEDLVQERGFGRIEFDEALSLLQTTPDRLTLLKRLITQLQNEGLDFVNAMAIETHATRLAREQLTGITPQTQATYEFCDTWISSNPPKIPLRGWCDAALAALEGRFNDYRANEILACFLMRAVIKCVDLN